MKPTSLGNCKLMVNIHRALNYIRLFQIFKSALSQNNVFNFCQVSKIHFTLFSSEILHAYLFHLQADPELIKFCGTNIIAVKCMF